MYYKTCNFKGTRAVVCTDISGKELLRQVGVGTVGTSGNLWGVMVSTLAQNARDVGSIPVRGTIFQIFLTLTLVP